jgi:putative Mg2+ transporter-C (MgtC) family protein
MDLHAALAAAHGQGWQQVGELVLAFVLSSVVGLERQFRDKSAGLRTHTLVGTASALFLLVSKYGFGDVALKGVVNLDPSRVAAQIVSGIGFLGAGLIITRRGTIHGLTTAASVWETAAIGMAAGAGLPLLAVLVTMLHFVVVLGYTPLAMFIATRSHAERSYTVTYQDGHGVLRDLLQACTKQAWSVNSLAVTASRPQLAPVDGIGHLNDADLVTVSLSITGAGVVDATGRLGAVEGVVRVDRGDEDVD